MTMDCPEHERLEQLLLDVREEMSKAAPQPDTEEFEKEVRAESQAIDNLKDHDAEHHCQQQPEELLASDFKLS